MIEQINKIADIWWSWMWPMFWQAGVLIVSLGVVDLVIRRRVWPQLRYALWLLVLVKLVLPPTFSLSTSLTSQLQPLAEQVLMRQTGIIGIATVPNLERDLTTAKPLVNTSIGPSVISQETGKPDALVSADREVGIVAPAGAVKPSRQTYAMLIWLLGTLILATWLIVKLRQLRGAHRGKAEEDALPTWFGKLLADTATKLNLRRLPKVAFSETVVCPAVFGVFRPILLLPKGNITGFSRKDTEHILLHELAHIKRGDLWVHSAYMVLQVVYWFIPMLWFVRRQLRHLRELCCDATVGRILQEKTADYRRTILENARRFLAKTVEPGMGLLGLFEDSNRLLVRLKWLEKKTWKYQHLRNATILAVVALMLACVLPMAKAQKSDKADMLITSTTDASGPIVDKSSIADVAAKPDAVSATSTRLTIPDPAGDAQKTGLVIRELKIKQGEFEHGWDTLSLSRDGSKLVYCRKVDRKQNLVVRNLVSGEETEITNYEGKALWPVFGFPVFSPDTRKIVYTLTQRSSCNLHIVSLQTGEDRRLSHEGFSVDWSRDGRFILVSTSADFQEDGVTYRIVPTNGGAVKELNLLPTGGERFSPDAKYVSYSHKGSLYLYSVDDGDVIQITRGSTDDTQPIWSPDGKMVLFLSPRAFGPERDLCVVPLADGKATGGVRVIMPDFGEDIWLISLSQTGRLLYQHTYKDEHIYVAEIDPQTGQPIGETRRLVAGTHPVWSPDGKRIAYLDEGLLHVMSADGSNDQEIIRIHYYRADTYAWAPDNDHIYIAELLPEVPETKRGIYAVSILAKEKRPVLLDHQIKGHLTCSPDGKRLAFLRWDPSSRKTQVFIVDVDGANLRQLTFDDDVNVHYPAWSPDGKHIAFESGPTYGIKTLTVVSVDDGTTKELFRGETPQDRFFGKFWSPDGNKIAWGSFDGPRIGQVSNGKYHTFKVDTITSRPSVPRWSPDGTKMLFHTHAKIEQLMIMDNFLPQANEAK